MPGMTFYFVMSIRAFLIVLSLAALSCDRDAPSAGGGPAGSASAAAVGSACTSLAEHWREVWTAEAPPGLDRRRMFVITRVAAAWADACASVAKEPAPDLARALDDLRAVKTFAAIEGSPKSGGSAAKQALVKSAQESVARTKSAFVIPPSGVDECEEAIAGAAFCGDDVDKASVKSAAKDKNDGACAALSVLLTKKCAQQ